jgi:adenylate cyclase
MHLLPLVAMGFLYAYGRVVCPFMDRTDPLRLLTGLAMVAVFQVVLREAALRWWQPREGATLARHAYRISVATWLAAGLAGVILHYFRYPDFHPSSHLKLLLGYGVLGAGILAQFEYSWVERQLRRSGGLLEQARDVRDRLGRRLMESFLAFTVAPALAMILMMLRYQWEGYVIAGVALEVSFIVLVFMGSGVFVAWHYGRLLREDADAIVEGLERIAAGHLDVHLSVPRPDEIGRVARGINDMAAGLRQRERIRDAFGRFVSPTVAAAVLRQWAPDQESDAPALGEGAMLPGQQREVTVLMADLRGFTPLSETMDPAALTDLLNGWFARAVAAAERHGGLVDKFIGDAVMVVFGVEDDSDTHAQRAVSCGQALIGEMEAYNRARLTKDPAAPVLELGVGIHSGPVVAGTVGGPQRMEFTVIGATVNMAARLEAQARAPWPQLLFSAATARALGAGVVVQTLGSASLKGIKQPVDLYGLAP